MSKQISLSGLYHTKPQVFIYGRDLKIKVCTVSTVITAAQESTDIVCSPKVHDGCVDLAGICSPTHGLGEGESRDVGVACFIEGEPLQGLVVTLSLDVTLDDISIPVCA